MTLTLTAQNTWLLSHSLDAVIFDCDGTLSQIEGIDRLAQTNDVHVMVRDLTEEAMGVTGMTPSIYQKRLALVKPNKQQVLALVDEYVSNVSPYAREVIEIFQDLGKAVYVVSAGIALAVSRFAQTLNIPKTHVFGVSVYFDEAGYYDYYDTQSPMAHVLGKGKVIERIKKKHPHIAHIGDGMNDVEVAKYVDRFIGYGGAFYRESIAKCCEFYIREKSLSSILPLCLTQAEIESLTPNQVAIVHMGMALLQKEWRNAIEKS